MPVLLMLDVVLDFMLDRVHAMTHVALRASSDDDVSNLVRLRKGAAEAAGAASSRRLSAPGTRSAIG